MIFPGGGGRVTSRNAIVPSPSPARPLPQALASILQTPSSSRVREFIIGHGAVYSLRYGRYTRRYTCRDASGVT